MPTLDISSSHVIRKVDGEIPKNQWKHAFSSCQSGDDPTEVRFTRDHWKRDNFSNDATFENDREFERAFMNGLYDKELDERKNEVE